ncbi:MAG: single-stranded DNA-binding protein [Methylotenera sp.]|nr:single-stranded DNA-binding protein [Methylotenera sp.]MDO9389322.1 single-stranded DNA-binding protein [Methylotenera sp.]
MIDALINGKLAQKPVKRISKSNNIFVTAAVYTPTSNGDNMRISVIAFDESVGLSLLALDEGDSVCMSGELTPKVWQPKDGGEPKPACDFTAHAVLTAYHVSRKRQAVQDGG